MSAHQTAELLPGMGDTLSFGPLDFEKILRRHVNIEPCPGTRWLVAGMGGRRAGQTGEAVATIRLAHSSAYEVVPRFDDGQTDLFAPYSLFPA